MSTSFAASQKRDNVRKLKVTTADLVPGMFVAQLDRAWLATPFAEHGFEIVDEAQLATLRKHCRHVYIDVSRSNLSDAQRERLGSRHLSLAGNTAAAVRPRSALLRRTGSVARRLDPTGLVNRWLGPAETYAPSHALHLEMPRAIAAYENAVATIGRVQRCTLDNGAVDVADLVRAATPLVDSIVRNPGALAWFATLTRKRAYAYDHSVATSVWAVLLGRHLELGRSSLDTLALGGMLLDIGMVFVPNSILREQRALNDFEKDHIVQHVDRGVALLEDITGIGQDILDMVACHHERFDGSGYPAKKSGSDIPVFGQIAALADCYDAMISDRDHAAALAPHEAIKEINSLAGSKFDAYLTRQFVETIGLFPSGSLVELNSGEVGLVLEQNGVPRLRPRILVLLDRDKQPVAEEHDLDLSEVSSDSRTAQSRWIVKGLERRFYNVDPANFSV